MSDGDRPAPLVPAEVDLRGLPGFMLDVNRLLSSELVALGTDAERWAALMLWCRAWHQIPATSLPDDDRVLAAFAGVSLAKWRRIRDMAMRGFVLCSDGRYYHQVLSQEALQAWGKRVAYRERRARDTERMQRWRESRDGAGDESVTRHEEPNGPARVAASRDGPVTPSVTRHNGVTEASPEPSHPPSPGSSRDGPVTQNVTLPPSDSPPPMTETGTGTEGDSDPERARAKDKTHLPVSAQPPPERADPVLRSKVLQAFVEHSPDGGLTWASQPSQHTAVDRLMERASHEPDPPDWLRRYLETAWQLREAGRDVWRGQPWVPAVICSPKMMPRVVEAMADRDQTLAEVPADLIENWGKR